MADKKGSGYSADGATREGQTAALADDEPPFVAWFVIEADLDFDREEPLYASIRGPFATESKAESERDAQRSAWEKAVEEWDDGNPYDFKGWQVVETKIWDGQIRRLDRQDEESHRIAMDAASALGASLLLEEDEDCYCGGKHDWEFHSPSGCGTTAQSFRMAGGEDDG